MRTPWARVAGTSNSKGGARCRPKRGLAPEARRRGLAPEASRSPAILLFVTGHRFAAVVLGDLMLDTVLAPDRPLQRGTDVPGRVALCQGGSAANTAAWLARIGVRTTLVCAVGRDAIGRALVHALEHDGVRVHAHRTKRPTGRIGVFVGEDGERSFVADRGAADALAPEHLRPSWFAGAGALHLPAYSLLGRPLGEAGLAAAMLARQAGSVLSVDLASAGPLLAGGRAAAIAIVEAVRPDVLLSTADEARALLGQGPEERLLDLAPIAVVKRGADGATVFARTADDGGLMPEPGPAHRLPARVSPETFVRVDVATKPVRVVDSTGAGDAFDAGFLAAWLLARSGGARQDVALRHAAAAGNSAAARQVSRPRRELALAAAGQG